MGAERTSSGTSDAAPGMRNHPTALADWLRAAGEHVAAPVEITRVGAGQSNITSLVADATGAQWILREPPSLSGPATAHDVGREAGIISALSESGVPVPRVVGSGTAPDGAPFLVMERMAGAALESESDAAALTAVQRHRIGIQVATILGQLHTLDPAILGLPAPRTSYLTRQRRRVREAWERHGTASRHHEAWTDLFDQLQLRAPAVEPVAVIAHGDFRLSNLLVADGVVTAVLDWELCAIGNPLADLAWLLDDWKSPEEPAIVMPSPTRVGGFGSRDELLERYRDATGLDLDRLDYYRAFSQWRAASLLQGVLSRRSAGVMGSHGAIDLTALDASIATLLESAAAHLRIDRQSVPDD